MTKALALAPTQRITSPTDAPEFTHYAKSANTQLAYRKSWADFAEFCYAYDHRPLPATVPTIEAYIAWCADHNKPGTIDAKLAAISFAHRAARQPDPTSDIRIKTLMEGVRRRLGNRPAGKAALTNDLLARAIKALPSDTLRGKRDRAILLLAFTGAFRRSELVALTMQDVTQETTGLVILVRRSKTDQSGAGMTKHIPARKDALCPVAALRTWIKTAEITSGPLFRRVDRWGKVGKKALDAKEIARIVKRAAQAAGLDASKFAGHSLRAGFVTSAAMAGVDEWKIQEQTGHKSLSVMRGYIRATGRGARQAALRAFDKPE